MNNNCYEIVEWCSYCENENIYSIGDIDVNGYVVICKHCGAKIMLCDECLHAEDNPNQNCDWCSTEYGGKCFRGIINR